MADNDFSKQFKKIVMEEVNNLFKDIPQYVIEIGVYAGGEKDERTETVTTTTVDDKGKEKKKKTKQAQRDSKGNLITNAHIMFIMEYGSDVNHIPARPVLEKTIQYAKKDLLQKTVETGLKQYLVTGKLESFEKELEKMCLRMENYCKTGIRRNTLGLAPNAESTIRQKSVNGKRGDIPLLNTGQLANSIQCKYKRV